MKRSKIIEGYSPKRAWTVKNAIDLDVAAIEDRVQKLRSRVTDTTMSSYFFQLELESLRDYAETLKAIVDHRTSQ